MSQRKKMDFFFLALNSSSEDKPFVCIESHFCTKAAWVVFRLGSFAVCHPPLSFLHSLSLISCHSNKKIHKTESNLLEFSLLQVQCCCFSPGKATLVFAGTSVGSVLLWDLREQASIHYRLKIGQDEWTFRQPTFSTGG